MNTTERKQLGVEKARQLANALGSSVELMAGESVKAAVSESNAGAWPEAAASLALKCTFGFTEAPLWVVAAEEAWSEIANAAVTGAGIEDADADMKKQTWSELVTQAASPLIADRTQDPTAKLTLKELPAAPADETAQMFAVELTFGSKTFSRFYISFAADLLDAFGGKTEVEPEEETGRRVPPTLDRLLDVELPLSISFGRTNVPVHEILKLASGSIIELNCPANDLVEIIVNNCMIARGEVVVIEGNYGVRVREIISRGERMALHNGKGHGAAMMKISA